MLSEAASYIKWCIKKTMVRSKIYCNSKILHDSVISRTGNTPKRQIEKQHFSWCRFVSKQRVNYCIDRRILSLCDAILTSSLSPPVFSISFEMSPHLDWSRHAFDSKYLQDCQIVLKPLRSKIFRPEWSKVLNENLIRTSQPPAGLKVYLPT